MTMSLPSRHRAVLPALAALLAAGPASAQNPAPPDHVDVLPVFLVPQGQPLPTPQQQAILAAHLEWSRQRFHEMLGCRDTFTTLPGGPHVYAAAHTLDFYRQLPENAAPQWTSELLQHYGYDRFDDPHVFVIVVMNPIDDFPTGGGRPCNGGFDTGGGIIILSSFALDHHPEFQSTLQHELGHAFGLPHVDVYGYDMQTNASIMSYNPAHHTNGFEPSDTPGILIPEDVRGLGYNDRVLPRLAFDPAADVPDGYEPAPPVWLGPMTIPGEVDDVVVATTPSGEAYGSSIQNVVQGWIKPSAGPGITFDPATMWHSDPTSTGWVEIRLTFPLPVTLDCITIHSQHSGLYHAAEQMILGAITPTGQLVVADSALDGADDSVSFPATEAAQWVLWLRAGASMAVTVRGLQFHDGATELFPPFIPEPVTGACRPDLDRSGAVGFADLLVLLAGWGEAPANPADLDCDGAVGFGDLLVLLAAWGPCA